MQLKGLVRFFAIALTLICLYQLSFTWFVNSHESAMEKKATEWLKRFPTAEQQYPGNKELQAAYTDSLEDLKKTRLLRLLDSTKDTKLAFGLTTYRSAKEKELMLGLDLQGGMSVTMEVGLDGLIKSLSNYTKDANFNKALDAAVARKANSGADLITLFLEEYSKVSPEGKLAPFFTTKSASAVKIEDSNAKVENYLRKQAEAAFNNTFRILRTRIDRFGVSSNNINPDPAKGRINIELAGVNDKDRVRNYLQSTANLQFFEVYTWENKDVQSGIVAADKAVQDYLTGADKVATVVDTTKASSVVQPKGDTSKTATISSLASKATPAKTDSAAIKATENPILRLMQITQPYQAENGRPVYPAALGYIQSKDTGTLNDYLAMESVKSKFPSNLVFMYGKAELDDPKAKDILTLYAVKTLDNGQAELEGDRIAGASQDYDERGRIAIKMNMDKVGSNIWAKMTTRSSWT